MDLRLLIVGFLLAATAWGRPHSPIRILRGNAAPSYFFEFAPASGAGMTAVCACTTPTGAKGELMTFSRASTAYCTKGNETTGIVNGDLVSCAAGQPRVMPGGDGTGGLGLNTWEARTDLALRSQELDNAAWVNETSGAAAITITADAAIAPDGTLTAERFQIPAVTATQFSLRSQSAFAAATSSASVFVRGNGTSGNTCVAVGSNATLCPFVSSSWTRCLKESVVTGAGEFIRVGNYGTAAACGALGAVDVFVWGAQAEAGTTVSPYIPTTSAAATRVVEMADVAINLPLPTGFSLAFTYVAPSAFLVHANLVSPQTGAPGAAATATYIVPFINGPLTIDSSTISPTNVSSGKTVVVSASNRIIDFVSGTTLTQCVGVSNCASSVTAYTAPSAFTRVRLAGYSTASAMGNGTVKSVCFDPTPSRCR